MIIRVLDPTNERKAAGTQPAERPSSLQGKTVGFISTARKAPRAISRTSSACCARSWCRRGGMANEAQLQRTGGRPLVDEIKNWHAVVAGVGD